MVVAIATSVSITNGNWYLPMAFLITAWVLLFVLRGRVKEVIADERDHKLAGKASLYTMTAYNVIAVISGLILYVSQKDNIALFSIGNTLMYSALFLMSLYAILFKIYERKDERN